MKKLVSMTAVAFLAAVLNGDTLTWTGEGNGTLWSDPANWSSDGTHKIPQSGDSVIACVNVNCYVTNDIPGLELPHLELKYKTSSSTSATRYAYYYGERIKLTGGENALKCSYIGTGYNTVADRLRCYLPFELSEGTNVFDLTKFRLHQHGVISGPGTLSITDANYYTLLGKNTYTGGTIIHKGYIDPSADPNFTANTPYGAETGLIYVPGTYVQQRIYFRPVNYDFHFANQSGRSASSYSILLYRDTTFNGRITGDRVAFQAYDPYYPTINGDIELTDKLLFSITESTKNMKVFINGHVTAASLDEGMDSLNYGTVDYTINSSDNAFGTIYVKNQNFKAGAVNAFGTNSVIRMGILDDMRGIFDCSGFDQRIDRILLNDSYLVDDPASKAHRITSTTGHAKFTLAATQDCETDAFFADYITLVWAPKGDYQFKTYADCGRDMSMNGGIIVSNGMFTVNGNNAFPKASFLEIADGATFTWNSSRSFGLRSLTSLSIGNGGTFQVTDSANSPFCTNTFQANITLDLAPNANFLLPSGMSLPVISVITGGVEFAVGTVFSGTPGEAGTVYLPQLSGTGARVKVVGVQTQISNISSLAYVQDGLLCHLDGIDNAGRGIHDSSARIWKDLSGAGGDFAITNDVGVWKENGFFKSKAGLLAINTNRCSESSVKTLEAAVAQLDTASKGALMPVFHSTYKLIVIHNYADSRQFCVDRTYKGFDTTELPPDPTISVVWGDEKYIYQNGVLPAGTNCWVDSWSDNNVPANSMTLGSRAVSWVGSESGTYNYLLNGVRMYNRKLTPEEVWKNYEVDCYRYRGTLPEGAVWYRNDPADPEIINCRLDVAMSGGIISVDDREIGSIGSAWPCLGSTVKLSVALDSYHEFIEWKGDTDAIVSGSVTSREIEVLVDRALSFSVATESRSFVVTADTNLTQNITCGGIRFTGPWTLTANDGVYVSVDAYGEGITIDEETEGDVVIACPLVIGEALSGDEQIVSVPSGAALSFTAPLGGMAPLRFTGGGTCTILAGGTHSGDIEYELSTLRLTGVFSGDDDSVITMGTNSILYLDSVDLGKRVDFRKIQDKIMYNTASTTNRLRSGFRILRGNTTPQPFFQLQSKSELTIEGSFNYGGEIGIYPSVSGSGILNIRTGGDLIGCFGINNGITAHVWNNMYVTQRSNYNRLHNGAKMYLHVENAISRSPWQIRGYLDLCGFDQTMGRFSYMSEGTGDAWECYNTGVIHSDEPAKITVYHDDNAGGGGNKGWQVFGGKFTGMVSFEKTGASSDISMTTNNLVLAGTSTSTGSVAVTWGLLSFTNSFTLGSTAYIGAWPNCTFASASGKGTLELCHSKALGRMTDVYIGEGGKVRLPAGVRQRVRYIYLPDETNGEYVRQSVGAYGSSASSAPAANRLDTYFEGSGLLVSAGIFDGTALIFK